MECFLQRRFPKGNLMINACTGPRPLSLAREFNFLSWFLVLVFRPLGLSSLAKAMELIKN